MATQAKKEKSMLRQAVTTAPAPVEEVVSQPQADEPVALYQDNRADRIMYIVWLLGAALLLAHFLGDTIVGLFF